MVLKRRLKARSRIDMERRTTCGGGGGGGGDFTLPTTFGFVFNQVILYLQFENIKTSVSPHSTKTQCVRRTIFFSSK